MRSFVDEQVAGGVYSTGGEYVRELIRKDQDRRNLRELLLEGAMSPLAAQADDAYFENLREGARHNSEG